MHDEGVGNAVESVFTEFVLARDALVDGVRVDVGGHSAVEGRVKVGDVFRVGEDVGDCADDAEGRGVVQWSEVTELFDVVVCFFVDDLALGIVTAMDNTVTGEADVFLFAKFGEALVVGEVVEDVAKSIFL